MSVMFSTHSNTFASFHLRPYPMFQDKGDDYQRNDRDFSLSDFRSSLSLNYLHTELLFLVIYGCHLLNNKIGIRANETLNKQVVCFASPCIVL